MTVHKEELEQILDNLASTESRQTFFKTAIGNKRLDCESVPDKYIDEVLEMEPTNARISTNSSKFREDPKKKIQLNFIAELAEHSENYATAANLYKQLDHIKKAVECAEKAGLTDLADKWVEEYVQEAYTEDKEMSGLRDSELNSQILGAVHRAEWLGKKDMAQKIAADYLASFTDEALNKLSRYHRARLCEQLGQFGKEHGPDKSESEKFYKRAMQIHEENGNYFEALHIAERNLKDHAKCRLYENLIETSGTDEQRAHLSEVMEGREWTSGE